MGGVRDGGVREELESGMEGSEKSWSLVYHTCSTVQGFIHTGLLTCRRRRREGGGGF